MVRNKELEQSYMVLVEFLMLAKRRIIETAGEYGLTGMQAMTIFLLDRPRPMNSFGKIYNCDPSNVTGIVDGLEEKGLVKRFENPKDRRIKMVEACAEGIAIRTALLQELTGPDSYMLRNLSPAEIGQFIGLVGKITGEQSSGLSGHRAGPGN
jgi:DNA-binding MarR family transcriptional regulator